ncbi:MAG: histidine phosphatase family protein [Oscillospiraceae bacterium]
MKLFFARHGESEGNVKLLLYGHTDCPLTDAGRQDAAALGEKLAGLDIKRCYTSPLSRAADTARIALAGRDVPITLSDDLMEQYMGDFENTSFVEMREKYPDLIRTMLEDWTTVVPPNGESYAQLSERSNRCLDNIIEQNEDALVVAHNGTLSAIFGRLLATEPSGIDKFWFHHGCYSCVDIEHKRIRLEYFNK